MLVPFSGEIQWDLEVLLPLGADGAASSWTQLRPRRTQAGFASWCSPGRFSWCDAEADAVLDDTPISDGIRYARNQRGGLSRFLHDGRLPIHNNMSELALRREAIGRKNWLFVGSDDGGAVNALFTSLLASCRLHDVEPWSYLRDVFCLLPRWSEHRLLDAL